MARLNGFSNEVIEILGKRNGFRCSFPNCTAVTFGPSAENSMSSSNTGTAAHIVAAGTKGSARRVDLNMPDADKQSIDNGIYMCQTHGKLIDTDEVLYTVEILKAWKTIAVQKAQLRQSLGIPEILPNQLQGLTLAPGVYNIASTSNVNDIVDRAIVDSCLYDLWGEPVAHAVTDFTIEYIKNAFLHGNANEVHLSVSGTHLEVADDGAVFDIANLNDGRGGAMALSKLRTQNARVAASCSRGENGNILRIRFIWTTADVRELSPCSAIVARDDLFSLLCDGNFSDSRNLSEKISNLFVTNPIDASCDTIYLGIDCYLSYSDEGLVQMLVKNIPHKNVVLVFDNLSEGVKECLERGMPGVKVIVIKTER